jgi:hypothetical protein
MGEMKCPIPYGGITRLVRGIDIVKHEEEQGGEQDTGLTPCIRIYTLLSDLRRFGSKIRPRQTSY